MKLSYAVLALPLAIGCSSSQPQVLTGHINPGFPTPITSVTVIKGSSVVATAPIAADGSFRLSVPAGTGYSIRLVSTGQTALVFPRHSGSINTTFAIRPGGVSFDLGGLHYLGTSTTTFAFHDGAASGTCNAEDHDSTGATCIDDGDTSGGTCEAGDGGSEGSDGADSGSDAGAEPADLGDAVADHNFPADGCADGGDNGGDDSGSDGTDGSGADGSGA